MLIVIVGNLIYLQKYGYNTIDDLILNKKWYNYDYSSGFYNTLFIKKSSLVYNNSDSNSNYTDCKLYNYNKSNNTISMDCGKNIVINKIEDNKLVLYIDSKTEVFFSNEEDAINYEFESYYGKSISEYKKEMTRVKDYLKINYERLLEIADSDDKSEIIFIGDKCSSVDCVLSLSVIENMLSDQSNIYYFDSSELSDDNKVRLLSEKIDGFKENNNYNNIYPVITTISNNKVIDEYRIKCSGFNCNKYIKE